MIAAKAVNKLIETVSGNAARRGNAQWMHGVDYSFMAGCPPVYQYRIASI
jgi:hypothetical protein